MSESSMTAEKRMRLRLTIILSICGFCPIASFADDERVLLEAVDKYSYCTPYYGVAGYVLGIVGTNWALTFEVPEQSFSGPFRTKKAYFYLGPDIHRYIGKPVGPARPPVPHTKQYSKIELDAIGGDVQRIEIYDKVMGPIIVSIDDFRVNQQLFQISSQVNILCMGPLP